MSSKTRTVFVCSQCGAESAKWYGKCPSCGEWNSLIEEVRTPPKAASAAVVAHASSARALTEVDPKSTVRCSTGIGELDRVLGGGIVPGGLMLIGGEPGIGKSTLLLQICAHLGDSRRVLYVSGEESESQIKLRAERLNVSGNQVYLLCETDLDTVLAHIRSERPDLVIIDSIQTMHWEAVSSSAGSVTQVRECTNALMREVKMLNIATFLVGHVNKDGAIAGPKVMEHIVDCVMYFEGDRNTSYRLLRCAKNRYGSTNEIGMFEMGEKGLQEVPNPSQALLEGRPTQVSGTCIACMMEGTRPLLAEIQALVTPTGFGNPRRMATGFDYNRLYLLLAVLEKRCGYLFSNLDAYINVVGGLRMDEPAADLPVALALISSLKDRPFQSDVVAFGEVGLAGELRSVSHIESRVREAARLGIRRVVIPAANLRSLTVPEGMDVIGARTLREAYDKL